MQKSQKQSPQEAFGVQDILYILFKHKWKILILSMLGFGASAFVFVNREVLYQSQANILVSYVLNRSTVDDFQSQTNTSGGPGDQVINTEVEIITSENLALAVADAVGIDKILPDAPQGAKLADAAATILGHLEVGVTPGNNVLHISYSNPNRDYSVLVLNELVKQYSIKHLELHRSAAAFDDVSKQSEEVRLRLKQTETELDKLRSDSGITTLAGATGALENQKARTREDLMAAKAELAEKAAHIEALEKSPLYAEEIGENGVKKNPKDGALGGKVPLQVLSEYKALLDMLGVLQKRDLELRMKFTSGNRLVSATQERINEAESKRRDLVVKYPELLTQSALLDSDSKSPEMSLFSEKANLASVTAKVKAYEKHLEEIDEQYKEQYALGSQIEVLDRRRQLEDAEYRSLELKLKDAILDKRLDPTRMPNLRVIQDPSTPKPTYDKLTKKIVAGLAAAGIGIGVGLAFLIELLFDRRIKRPTDIQARLQLPLLLSIPYIKRKDRGGLMLAHEPNVPRIGTNGTTKESVIQHKITPETAIRKANHFILPYSETIRDRIIFNFEVNNVTHKPKLVAVTGLSEGAGASTIAAGLAKSFSEINGAKVLLVDLSSYHPEDNPIFGEVARYSLTGALQLAKGPQFKASDQNLYYASATARRDESGLTTFSPMHLYEMMPHLQASDYDYIIFDMPPIDQTSRTLTMAGLMDKVILVLDAENTSRDALKWGYSELGKGKADVSCIFNKTRSHAPGWLIGQS
ncbi:MAG: Wzz/FepE/Etk N-terminal domain-containing protein [Luteolibacter sp.]|uniref:GumC family protein n=1 Tax=Luteolibacter sp. TaxID=1962973 RepID=UPI003265AB21